MTGRTERPTASKTSEISWSGTHGNTAQKLREQVSGTDHFISLAKRYTDIQELTPELLRLFIQKIVVHEKDVKWNEHAQQTVEIYYNDIGCVELPQTKGHSTAKGA